jgi:hypothetical protein
MHLVNGIFIAASPIESGQINRPKGRQARTMKRHVRAGLLGGLFALAVLLPGQHVANAEERTCRGSLGAITVDNLRVPQGATCTLTRTYAKGTIKVEANATLYARGVRVIGNIQAENAAHVDVRNWTLADGSIVRSRVGGSIQIVQGGSANILSVIVNGDILFDENSRALAARSNRVGGNLQAFQNTGGVTITANTIDGNLQCKANNPAPTGGRNIVHGNKEDQCARL